MIPIQGTPAPGGPIGDLIGAFLFPLRLVVAVVLLVLGYVVGQWFGGKARALVRRVEMGEAVMETPLGALFRDAGGVESTVETLVTYFVVVVAVLMAVSMAGFNRLTGLVLAGAEYFPSIIGGVLVVLVGFVAAGYVARSIKESDELGGRTFTPLVILAAKGVIYFVSITLGLDALGYSTAILNTLAQAVAVGLGLGIALAIGIGLGMGSQEYVAENIDTWLSD